MFERQIKREKVKKLERNDRTGLKSGRVLVKKETTIHLFRDPKPLNRM